MPTGIPSIERHPGSYAPTGSPRAAVFGRWLLTLFLAGMPLAAQAGSSANLQGQVDITMAQQVTAAIGRHDKIIDLDSTWRAPDGQMTSGGISDLGWLLGDSLHLAGIKVRCTGLCFSSAAHILIASRGCIVGRQGRVALHVPQLNTAAIVDVSLQAHLRTDVVESWRKRMESYGVPSDIVDRALSDRHGVHELSTYEMKRIGCEVE
jgi:hypothetical protein